jgi:hypothetical protein
MSAHWQLIESVNIGTLQAMLHFNKLDHTLIQVGCLQQKAVVEFPSLLQQAISSGRRVSSHNYLQIL